MRQFQFPPRLIRQVHCHPYPFHAFVTPVWKSTGRIWSVSHAAARSPIHISSSHRGRSQLSIHRPRDRDCPRPVNFLRLVNPIFFFFFSFFRFLIIADLWIFHLRVSLILSPHARRNNRIRTSIRYCG